MKTKIKDIIIFGGYIVFFSFISIIIALSYDLERGIIYGGIAGVGILLVISCRNMFKTDTLNIEDAL